MNKFFSWLLNETKQKPTLNRRLEAADKLYELCLEIRNFEIQNLIARNNFFMVFQGVLIAGFIQGSGTAPPVAQLLGSGIGLLVSVFQFMTASGAKFWQESWETQLETAETALEKLVGEEERGFQKLFSGEPKNRTRSRLSIVRRFSVSKAPIYAAVVFCFFWLVMLICTFDFQWTKELLNHVKGLPLKAT